LSVSLSLSLYSSFFLSLSLFSPKQKHVVHWDLAFAWGSRVGSMRSCFCETVRD
jgi:hypothetical protein